MVKQLLKKLGQIDFRTDWESKSDTLIPKESIKEGILELLLVILVFSVLTAGLYRFLFS